MLPWACDTSGNRCTFLVKHDVEVMIFKVSTKMAALEAVLSPKIPVCDFRWSDTRLRLSREPRSAVGRDVVGQRVSSMLAVPKCCR